MFFLQFFMLAFSGQLSAISSQQRRVNNTYELKKWIVDASVELKVENSYKKTRLFRIAPFYLNSDF